METDDYKCYYNWKNKFKYVWGWGMYVEIKGGYVIILFIRKNLGLFRNYLEFEV